MFVRMKLKYDQWNVFWSMFLNILFGIKSFCHLIKWNNRRSKSIFQWLQNIRDSRFIIYSLMKSRVARFLDLISRSEFRHYSLTVSSVSIWPCPAAGGPGLVLDKLSHLIVSILSSSLPVSTNIIIAVTGRISEVAKFGRTAPGLTMVVVATSWHNQPCYGLLSHAIKTFITKLLCWKYEQYGHDIRSL